ncbi:MAG: hypothetical protein JXB04_09205 [Kiritimatiellae bacterium]|nr:hypothetical protein [Kiritimatiellia bacterium]
MVWDAETKAEVFRGVKGVLVRHCCDLGLISIAVTKSMVSVRGSLRRAPGATSELSAESLNNIYDEIRQVRNIPRVDFDFDNWRQAEGGKWKKVK